MAKNSFTNFRPNQQRQVPVPPDSSIFIPGAGLTSLTSLLSLADIDHPIILNDKSLFVSSALSSAVEALSLTNIQVVSDEWSNLQFQPESIGLVLCSLLHAAGPSGVDSLFNVLDGSLVEDGLIVVWNRQHRDAYDGGAGANDYLKGFKRLGLSVEVNDNHTNFSITPPQWGPPHFSI